MGERWIYTVLGSINCKSTITIEHMAHKDKEARRRGPYNAEFRSTPRTTTNSRRNRCSKEHQALQLQEQPEEEHMLVEQLQEQPEPEEEHILVVEQCEGCMAPHPSGTNGGDSDSEVEAELSHNLNDDDHTNEDVRATATVIGDEDDDPDEGVNGATAKTGHFADDESDLEDAGDLTEESPTASSPVPSHKPLYPGSRVTLSASMLLIAAFVLRHGLTGVATIDLLALIELHCLLPNICVTNYRVYQDFFKRFQMPSVHHYYCKKCYAALGTVKPDACHICNSNNMDFFISLSISNQISEIFSSEYIIYNIST